MRQSVDYIDSHIDTCGFEYINWCQSVQLIVSKPKSIGLVSRTNKTHTFLHKGNKCWICTVANFKKKKRNEMKTGNLRITINDDDNGNQQLQQSMMNIFHKL